IKAAVHALHNMDNVPTHQSRPTDGSPDDLPKERAVNDVLDWLSSVFGFQVTCIFISTFVITLSSMKAAFFYCFSSKGKAADLSVMRIPFTARMKQENKNFHVFLSAGGRTLDACTTLECSIGYEGQLRLQMG
ncbi:hypothetical protein Tsubulata_026072, partial [Turnera subulata]